MNPMRVLVVEDDQRVASFIQKGLEEDGLAVDILHDGDDDGSPYVTGVLAHADLRQRTLTYTNGGHPPGVLVRNGADRGLSTGALPWVC